MAAQIPLSRSDADVMGIVDVLVKKGKLTGDIREQARMSFVTTGMSATDWLVSQKLVNESDLAEATADFYNVPFVKLADKAVSSVALGYVDKGIAQRFHLLPFDYKVEEKGAHKRVEHWIRWVVVAPVLITPEIVLEERDGKGFSYCAPEITMVDFGRED
jgi:hypothetical protein